MTLFRQLLIFTLVLCFVLFVGVWVYKLQSTRQFLENQLEVHSQDTATSLGLSLSPFAAADDLAGIETMLNAVFDRGYYREIRYSDVHGEVISKRILPVTVEQVPAWFIDLIPLTVPGGEALIMDGWKRAGSVYVESHPGYAYQTLWHTFVRISVYFLLTGLAVFVLGGLGLQVLLRPLRRVEAQADAICRKEYEIQDRIPKTRELRQVVTSMNAMTARVREMFEEQAAIAARLREEAFGDPLTGLGNRRFLETQVKVAMEDGREEFRGLFLLVQIRDLKRINEEKGYHAGDQLLVRAAEVIADTVSPYGDIVAARLAGGDFGIFMPDADRDDSEQLAAWISERLAGLAREELGITDDICSIGGIFYNTPCSFEQLLAKSDHELSTAHHQGANRWQIEAVRCDDEEPPQGKVWWRQNLEQSLADRAFNLYGQRVVQTGAPAAQIHLELFSRITIDAKTEVPAGVFIPLAERSALITELDRRVIELVLDAYEAWPDRALAVNLSVSSLLDADFTGWLMSRLSSLADKSLEICFELAEFSIVNHIEELRAFGMQIRPLGHGLGIDHFGRSFSNFGYLKSLQPDYVKIDAAFTRELSSEHSDAYFFIGSLTGVAHSLDIKVIANGVETEAQLAAFRELKVDGYQGYLVEKPQLLTSRG